VHENKVPATNKSIINFLIIELFGLYPKVENALLCCLSEHNYSVPKNAKGYKLLIGIIPKRNQTFVLAPNLT
jgi:hypothetical protein